MDETEEKKNKQGQDEKKVEPAEGNLSPDESDIQELRYFCEICDKQFLTEEDAIRHVWHIHKLKLNSTSIGSGSNNSQATGTSGEKQDEHPDKH